MSEESGRKTIILEPSKEGIAAAAEIIRGGGLVVFPTETVYGLGTNALSKEAVEKIYRAKGRPGDNPVIVHIADESQLNLLAEDIPAEARTLASRLWPGPLTMILKKKPQVPDEATGGLSTVAIRMPADDCALALIEAAGCPVAAPSANLSGRPSPTSWQHAFADMNGRVDAIIRGSPCRGGIESTVLDITKAPPVILRPGLVSPEEIEAACGGRVVYTEGINLPFPLQKEAPPSPGMKYRHYAPAANMIIFSGKEEAVVSAIAERRKAEEAAGRKVGILDYSDVGPKEVAKTFFADLRAFDEEKVDIILAVALPEGDSVNFSIMNRMLKAASFEIREV